MSRRPTLLMGILLLVASCGGPAEPAKRGRLSELSRVSGDFTLCNHRVPDQVCTRHNPGLVGQFKRAGDWCPEHGIPESQCYECHPDLSFEPLAELPKGADLAWLAKAGEDVPDLDVHAVKGKVTVFEFYAEWCGVCRKVDGHIYRRLASGERSLAYRKLNVVEWESPLGQRYLNKVPSLPLLIVYGPSGKRFRTLYGGDLSALDQAIAEAARR